jgi:hypothetical protein
MTDRPNPVKPPTLASPARRVLHTIIALGGWALFVYWWWLVFHRVSRHEVRFTALFIAISLAVIVLITAAWAFHNLQIFRRRPGRTHVRDVEANYRLDGVGRSVAFTGAADACLNAPVVHVRMVGDGKMYVATRRLAAAGPAPGPEPGPAPDPALGTGRSTKAPPGPARG